MDVTIIDFILFMAWWAGVYLCLILWHKEKNPPVVHRRKIPRK